MHAPIERGETRIRVGKKVLYEGKWSNNLYDRINAFQSRTGKTVRVESVDGRLWFEQHLTSRQEE